MAAAHAGQKAFLYLTGSASRTLFYPTKLYRSRRLGQRQARDFSDPRFMSHGFVDLITVNSGNAHLQPLLRCSPSSTSFMSVFCSGTSMPKSESLTLLYNGVEKNKCYPPASL